jgi:hypothetical protein
VAQPFDRSGIVPPAGDLEKDQFWVGNPWAIVAAQKNLSAYERNRTFLNLGLGRFVDVSFFSGADSDGDGRAVVAADLDGDGMEDLIVRQAGGGPLLLFQNRFPRRHYLRVSLRGTASNGLGIGARLSAHANNRQLVREMYPADTYVCRQPCEVYFGLGDATQVDRLTIRWPSGQTQELTSLAADRHIRVTEGQRSYKVISTSNASVSLR